MKTRRLYAKIANSRFKRMHCSSAQQHCVTLLQNMRPDSFKILALYKSVTYLISCFCFQQYKNIKTDYELRELETKVRSYRSF